MVATIETLLKQTTGGFGRWHMLVFFAGSMTGYFSVFNNLGKVFLGATPQDYWCLEPYIANHLKLENSGHYVPFNTTWTFDQMKSISLPKDKDGHFSKCQLYVRNYTEILSQPWKPDLIPNANGSGYHPPIESCDRWQYDQSEYEETVVTEWNLVCDRKALLSTVQASYFAGVVVGCFLFGIISDRFGRRKALMIALILNISAIFVSVFSPTYWFFLAARFVVAIGGAGLFSVSYITVMELLQPKMRTSLGIAFQIPFSLGYMTLPLLAYFIRNWHYLQLSFAILHLLQISFYWIMPESPRWLITKGRYEETEAILLKGARLSGTKDTVMEKSEMYTMMQEIHSQTEELSVTDKKVRQTGIGLILLPWKTRKMRIISLSVFFTWFAVSLAYYGLALYAPEIGSSVYLVVFLSGLVEIPAYLFIIFFLDKLGRRLCYCITFVAGGVACLVILAVPAHLTWLIITLAVSGKFCITATYAISYLYTAELFPTEIRTVSLTTGSLFSKVGGLLAPYVVDMLGGINPLIPLGIFGSLSLVAGFISFFLPETSKKNLKECLTSD